MAEGGTGHYGEGLEVDELEMRQFDACGWLNMSIDGLSFLYLYGIVIELFLFGYHRVLLNLHPHRMVQIISQFQVTLTVTATKYLHCTIVTRAVG